MSSKKRKATKKKSLEEWKFFDDCAICQATKNGQASTISGLKKAFALQNSRNSFMTMRVQGVNDLYYDAIDAISLGDFESAEKMLLKAKSMDAENVQTYVGLATLYYESHQKAKLVNNVKIAFEKTRKVFTKWPKRLEWGFHENRKYLRAIQYRADLHVEEGEIETAKELYRLVLQLNPNDNQGVRYLLAGLYEGVNGEGINKMFEEANESGKWNKLETLVDRQNKIHKFWKAGKSK